MRQSTHIRFPDKEPGSHLQDVASEHSPLAKCIAALIAISVLIIAPGTSNANSVREQAVHSHLILQGDVKDERGDAIGGAKVTLSSGNRRLEVLTE
ncbi:MAG TPA: hypothetical protein VEZ90_11745, partial [Blastocatellia bacterium]|nr:hypothetical protein [Blastocatellia bacterium]